MYISSVSPSLHRLYDSRHGVVPGDKTHNLTMCFEVKVLLKLKQLTIRIKSHFFLAEVSFNLFFMTF